MGGDAYPGFYSLCLAALPPAPAWSVASNQTRPASQVNNSQRSSSDDDDIDRNQRTLLDPSPRPPSPLLVVSHLARKDPTRHQLPSSATSSLARPTPPEQTRSIRKKKHHRIDNPEFENREKEDSPATTETKMSARHLGECFILLVARLRQGYGDRSLIPLNQKRLSLLSQPRPTSPLDLCPLHPT